MPGRGALDSALRGARAGRPTGETDLALRAAFEYSWETFQGLCKRLAEK